MKSLGFQIFIFSSLVEFLKNMWWRNVLYCKNGHMTVPQEVRFVFFQHLWESKLSFPRLLHSTGAVGSRTLGKNSFWLSSVKQYVKRKTYLMKKNVSC